MSDPAPIVSWSVRPPWPDELHRLRRHLPCAASAPHAVRRWYWVAAASDEERLVGTAQLLETEDRGSAVARRGRIEFSFQPAWVDHPAMAALLEAAIGTARASGLSEVVAQVAPIGPIAAGLRAAGFAAVNHHEVWRLRVPEAIAARLPIIERIIGAQPMPVRPVDRATLPAVRALCAAHHLLEPERVVLRGPRTAGIDPQFSFLAGDASRPAGIALARRLGESLYLEVLARDSAAAAPGRAALGALLKAVFLGARDAGIEEIQCAITPERAPAVVALLRRSGGERRSRQAVFAWRPTSRCGG